MARVTQAPTPFAILRSKITVHESIDAEELAAHWSTAVSGSPKARADGWTACPPPPAHMAPAWVLITAPCNVFVYPPNAGICLDREYAKLDTKPPALVGVVMPSHGRIMLLDGCNRLAAARLRGTPTLDCYVPEHQIQRGTRG